MKHMLSEKTKGEIQGAEHGAEELCRYHECARYLSEDVRKLVVQVLAEKLRQMNVGEVPFGLPELAVDDGKNEAMEELKRALEMAEKRAGEAEAKATRFEERAGRLELKVENCDNWSRIRGTSERRSRRESLRSGLNRWKNCSRHTRS